MIEYIFQFVVLAWLGAITTYLALRNTTFKLEGRVKVPKPPKPYTCPHGKISNLTPYTIRGQKRTLCNYCYKKEYEEELNKEVVKDVPKYDLPRL